MALVDKQWYRGRFINATFKKVGNDDVPILEVEMDIKDEGTQFSTAWLGDKPGKDGRRPTQRMFDTLVEFGCNREMLLSADCLRHINAIMKDKTVSAVGNEYKGTVQLQGLFVPSAGGGGAITDAPSPFAAKAASPSGSTPWGDSDDVPY